MQEYSLSFKFSQRRQTGWIGVQKQGVIVSRALSQGGIRYRAVKASIIHRNDMKCCFSTVNQFFSGRQCFGPQNIAGTNEPAGG